MYTIVNEYKSEIAAMKKAYNQAIATKDKTIATNEKALQKALSEIAELRRRLGVNSQTVDTDN